VLIVLMLLVGIVPMLREAARGKFDFFNLKNTFIIYFLLQLAVSGWVTLLIGAPSEIGLDPIAHSDAYQRALVISLFGLVAFQIGYYSRPPRPIRLPSMLKYQWQSGRAPAIGVAYFATGSATFVALLQLFGGLSAFLAQREELRSGGLIGFGILQFPATNLVAIGAMIYFLGRTGGSAPGPSRTKLFAIFAASLVPAYFLGFRSALGLPVLQYMVVWNYAYRRLSASSLVVTCSLVLVGFTIYGVTRTIPPDSNISLEMISEAAMADPELIYTVVSRSKGTEVVAAVIDKLDRTGEFELGWKAALETATIMIPKAIWPAKPSPISERFADYFFGDSLTFARGYNPDTWSGISPTVVGELYWHFGTVGVIMGLLLLGRIANAAYSTLRAYSANRSVVLVYAIFFTSFTMFAESLQNYVNGLVLYALALSFSLCLLTGSIKRDSAPVESHA
jgi:hypothetical protein